VSQNTVSEIQKRTKRINQSIKQVYCIKPCHRHTINLTNKNKGKKRMFSHEELQYNYNNERRQTYADKKVSSKHNKHKSTVLHRVPKKVVHQLISITQSILNGFSKFIHLLTLWKIWDKRIIKDFTTPKTCRCTTLWNINFQKLLELKHGNRKLSTHELKKMWSW